MASQLANTSQSPILSVPYQAIYLSIPQHIALSASSQQSSAVGMNTSVLRVVADKACYIAIGANPSATTGGHYLPANLPEYFACNGGDKVAGLQSATGTNLFISEGA